MKRTILVIEDDGAIRQGLVDALEFEGYAAVVAEDGNRDLELAPQATCDLILLDLVLPGTGGLEILRKVREARPTLPVIVLTARGQENDRVQGLRLGADDYVVKPFSVTELLARVEAVLRRSPERAADVTVVQIPGGCADLLRCEVRYDNGDRQDLSKRESQLLEYLARNAGRAISRDEIFTRVWKLNPNGIETRTIDMHVARLRDSSSKPSVVLTVRGKGYMLSKDYTGQA